MAAQVCIDNYVIIPSGHNVAEYRACLQFKPKRIYLAISTDAYIQKQSERLYQLLIKNLPDSSIQKLPSDGLEGESSMCTAMWIENIFIPVSKGWDGQQTVLNMTGGTKPLSMLLCQAYNWSALHYQPYQRSAAHSTVQVLVSEQNKFVPKDEINLSEPESILDLVRLYASIVEPKHTDNQQAVWQHSQSLTIAEQRLNAQSMDKPSADNLFPLITPVLNNLWYLDQPTGKEPYHLVPWDDFLLAKYQIEKTELLQFLQSIGQISPRPLSIEQDPAGLGVMLPTGCNSLAKTWRNWISGAWFEQLINHWLLELGIQPEHMVRAVEIARESGNPRGETDIILFYQQNIHFIEIKADTQINSSLSDLEKQLTSQSSELGMLNKVLIVTPVIKKRANSDAWNSFEGRCRDRRVKLIVASCKEDLADSRTGLNIRPAS